MREWCTHAMMHEEALHPLSAQFLGGANLLTGHTDEHWRAMRKAVAPAFSALNMRWACLKPGAPGAPQYVCMHACADAALLYLLAGRPWCMF